MAKYIFVTGGVVSGLGKGITASSIGLLLKSRNYKVFNQKFDPYINIDPGTMSPYQHGEVFVTKDGAETDLDVGHYERFIDCELDSNSSITTGKIYLEVINKERNGDYLGKTVQVIPHITDEIKSKIYKNGKDYDFIITEIGGTVGDIESLPFLEAIRQVRQELGVENSIFVHTTLIPTLYGSKELKTKPTQHSVHELRSIGIQPDILVCRASKELNEELKDKISLFCNIKKEGIINAVDVKNIYRIPINFYNQKMDVEILNQFKMKTKKIDLKQWNEIIDIVENLKEEIEISIVGKYVELEDAYLSLKEALKHAGYYYNKKIKINWVNSEKIDKNLKNVFKNSAGILVPGGFGNRGIEGKIKSIKYARENNIPFFGICLGMQLACIEIARNVCNIKCNSTEFDEKCENNIIDLMEEQKSISKKGGTLRLGNYSCELLKNTKIYNAYKSDNIVERHRHRYEFNNKFREILEGNGVIFSGINKKRNLVETIELKNHPYFVACQFHPEFKSRIVKPHPLFLSFVKACIK